MGQLAHGPRAGDLDCHGVRKGNPWAPLVVQGSPSPAEEPSTSALKKETPRLLFEETPLRYSRREFSLLT
jgi:hypothetical protein